MNSDMYIERRDLERKLRRAVNGTQNIIVFGDSGCGKTWLYKEYFESNGIQYRTVDLAVAVLEGLDNALLKSLPQPEWQEIKKTETGGLDASILVAKANEERTIEYQRSSAAALEVALSSFEKLRGSRKFLVFDNFEQITRNNSLVVDVASLIVRLDNEQFARYGVRFLFVGVISDMREIIARYDHAGTIANRLTEIPEVGSLSESESHKLIERGLLDKLKIEYDGEFKELLRRISFVTNRNAQQIHELCYQIACEAEENGWRLSSTGVDSAERDWVDTSLGQLTAWVEARMNRRETKIQRRNQVLFCLGADDSSRIRATQVDAMIRKLFPDKAGAAQLGVDQILSGLAEGSNPILVKNPNDNSYRLSDPKLRLAIRARLKDLTPKTVNIDINIILHKVLKMHLDSNRLKN